MSAGLERRAYSALVEEARDDLRYLAIERGLSWSSCRQHLHAARFLYERGQTRTGLVIRHLSRNIQKNRTTEQCPEPLLSLLVPADELLTITTQTLSPSTTNRIAVTAYQTCSYMGYHVTVSVVGPDGRPIAFLRCPLSWVPGSGLAVMHDCKTRPLASSCRLSKPAHKWRTVTEGAAWQAHG